MDKISIYRLSLVATHNCNLECAHCIRGNSSFEQMDSKVLDAVFDRIDRIDSLNITGGEPLLNPQIFEQLKKYIDKIQSLQIITNGTVYNPKVFANIAFLAKETSKSELNSSIYISKDKYHDMAVQNKNLTLIRQNNIEKIKDFCNQNNINFDLYDATKSLLNGGRAKNLKDVTYYHNKNNTFYTQLRFIESIREYINSISVDCNGDVCLNGNYSFDDVDDYKIGNALDHPIDEILHKELLKTGNKLYQG